MNVPYHIECVLKERKITDLLRSRGILPVKQVSNKILYRCPIHEGDKDPSFIVYTDKEYENYYCYGCHSGITVINLLSDLDNISMSQATSRLLKGIDIKEADVIDAIIKELKINVIINQTDILGELSLKLSVACYNHFKELNFNERELEFFDRFLQVVDTFISTRDIAFLRELYGLLVDQYIPSRVGYHLDKEEQNQIQSGETQKKWPKI